MSSSHVNHPKHKQARSQQSGGSKRPSASRLAAEIIALHTQSSSQAPFRPTTAQLLQTLVETPSKLGIPSSSVIALYLHSAPPLRLAVTNDPGISLGSEFASPVEFSDWLAQQQSAAQPRLRVIQIPLESYGNRLGILGICTRKKIEKTKLGALQELAHYFANSLYLQQLAGQPSMQAQLPEHDAEIVLRSISKASVATGSDARIVQRILAIVHEFIAFDIGALYVHSRGAQFIPVGVIQATLYKAKRVRVDPLSLPVLPILQVLIREPKPIYLENVASNPQWRPHLPNHTSGCWFAIPLVNRGQVVGLLILASHNVNCFSQSQLELIETASSALALLAHNILLTRRNQRERKQLSALAHQVMTVQEEERKSVSRELHDEAGQSLTALSLNLELLQDDLQGQSQSIVERARESVAMARETMERIRVLARQLRPPVLDTLGLAGALEQLATDFQRRYNIPVRVSLTEIDNLSDSVSITTYRLVQEALTNIRKHAQASAVELKLELDQGTMTIIVHDNGKGFDPDHEFKEPRRAGRLGLLGMRERLSLVHGKLEIHSVPGDGTRLTATIPLPTTPAPQGLANH